MYLMTAFNKLLQIKVLTGRDANFGIFNIHYEKKIYIYIYIYCEVKQRTYHITTSPYNRVANHRPPTPMESSRSSLGREASRCGTRLSQRGDERGNDRDADAVRGRLHRHLALYTPQPSTWAGDLIVGHWCLGYTPRLLNTTLYSSSQ